MAKKRKPKTDMTMIVAVDRDNHEAFCFYMVHDPETAIALNLAKAFQDWYHTPDGRKYVDENGTNWGDATYIPDEFLKKHGIYKYDALVSTSGYINPTTKQPRWKIAITHYDHTLTVDHNESLVQED